MQATQEGLVPLKAWVKSALDQVVQVYLKQPDLEFVWVGDDAIDPLEQAQTLQILVGAGIKTREEARADLGLAPGSKTGGFGKYNHNHDERGRFATANNAVEPTGGRGEAATVAQGPASPMFEEPPPEPVKPAEPAAPQRAAPPGTVAEAVAPGGRLPGVSPGGSAGGRNMPASDDPNAAALAYVQRIYNGQTPTSVTPIAGQPGAFYAQMPDGAFVTYRPAGQASERTPSTSATVEINDQTIKGLNGGTPLKLKFPQK